MPPNEPTRRPNGAYDPAAMFGTLSLTEQLLLGRLALYALLAADYPEPAPPAIVEGAKRAEFEARGILQRRFGRLEPGLIDGRMLGQQSCMVCGALPDQPRLDGSIAETPWPQYDTCTACEARRP